MTSVRALDAVWFLGRLVRMTYRATIVQVANRSRRRRRLPELDRYGRRCLIGSTALMTTFVALCGLVVLTAESRMRTAP